MITRRSWFTKLCALVAAMLFPMKASSTIAITQGEEQLEAQLSLCMMAAEGSPAALGIKGGEYGWSPALERVRELQEVASTLQSRIHKLRCSTPELSNCPPGSDYDPYIEGMANGKAYALAVLDGGGGEP